MNKYYLSLALEPIHIGQKSRTKGERKFRAGIALDLDGLPIIPASSLKGCVRAYSSAEFGYRTCDGKGLNCPQPHICPSCAVFGFTNYHHGRSSASLVRFSAATLAFAPIYIGNELIWIASNERLKANKIISAAIPETIQGIGEQISAGHLNTFLNLVKGHFESEVVEDMYSGITNAFNEKLDESYFSIQLSPLLNIFKKSMIVDETTFVGLNSLYTGTQTSVAIDPNTRRTKEGALFQTSHINKKSVFVFNVTFLNPIENGLSHFKNEKGRNVQGFEATFDSLEEIIKNGFEKIEYLGIGGKRSRGFGRMQIFPIHEEVHKAEEKKDEIISSPKPAVFISHSSQDKSIARRLAGDLTKKEIKVWLDEHKILAGAPIQDEIEKGVKESDFIILLMSKNSFNSNWVKLEVQVAKNKEFHQQKIVIIPALVEPLNEGIPSFIQLKKRAELYPRYEDGLQELIEAIWGHFLKDRPGH